VVIAPELPESEERRSSNDGTAIVAAPGPEPIKTAETGPGTEAGDIPSRETGEVSVAAAPEPDTGIYPRAEAGHEPEAVTAMPPPALTDQQSDINIPAGITFIFEGMFVNRELSHVTIPDRITSIGKHAFAGNPLMSVTIGANVAIDDEAFPGNFSRAYTSFGKAAGTYTRPDVDSEKWEKK
jgi:hypothetical protein